MFRRPPDPSLPLQDNAKAVFIVLHGSVAVYAPSDQEEDEYFHPATQSQEELKAVQRALDTIKTVAAVEPAKALAPVKKADVTEVHIESDSEEEEVAAFDVKKTWGTAMRRVKMAVMLNDAVDELKRGLVKKQASSMQKVHQCRVGACFGDVGITARLPMRSTAAIASRNTHCLVISRDDWVRMKDREELTSDLDDVVELLSGRHWLGSLGADVIHRLAFHARQVELPAGSLVVQEGEVTPLMYIIKEGEVNVLLRSHTEEDTGASGTAGDPRASRVRPYNVGIQGRGECFGEKPLLVGQPCDFAYVTRTACVLLAVGGKAFAAIKKRVFVAMMKALAQKLRFRCRRLAEIIATEDRVKAAQLARLPPPPLFAKSEAERRFVQPQHAARPLRISIAAPPASSPTMAAAGVSVVSPEPDLDTWPGPETGHFSGLQPPAASPPPQVARGTPSGTTPAKSFRDAGAGVSAAARAGASRSNNAMASPGGSPFAKSARSPATGKLSLSNFSRSPSSPALSLSLTHDPLRMASFSAAPGPFSPGVARRGGPASVGATSAGTPSRPASASSSLRAGDSAARRGSGPHHGGQLPVMSPIKSSPVQSPPHSFGVSTRLPMSPPQQVQPVESTAQALPHAPTGSLPGSRAKHFHASTHRDISSPLGRRRGGTAATGYVGAGRSPTKSTKSRRPAAAASSRKPGTPSSRKATAGASPSKPGRRRGSANSRRPSSSEEPARDILGDILAPPVMRATKRFMASYAGTSVEDRDFTKSSRVLSQGVAR